MGLMGFHTPNIDRVAKEGVIFTDYYAEQSCTAGRSSFITGQCGLRTGNTKVGMPGASRGSRTRRDHCPVAQGRWATPPASSAKTIWATGMNFCRPCTGSMSSTARSTI